MIELNESVTPARLEEAFRRGRRAQRARQQGFADTGMRLAFQRNDKLMKGLEQATAILQKLSVNQLGSQGIDNGGIRVEATEFSFIRESYKAADEGRPLRQCEWFYGMIAWCVGLQR
jgi:hypothetical protein